MPFEVDVVDVEVIVEDGPVVYVIGIGIRVR